jgi:hypothetical protein
LSSIDLGLSDELAKEWDQFRCALNDSGALIHDEEDKLMWTEGMILESHQLKISI